jgi:flagellar biosynthesis protein FlhB
MADVPTADVVVTNPTHYSVALRYDTSRADAPEVVAKGKGIIALRIRELAAEHGVPVIPDPPLARGLYASVEIGRLIPEEFFGAVAAVLAFVYRTAARRAAA